MTTKARDSTQINFDLMSTGQLGFLNSGGGLAGDNGLFWDNTNKRLGVGTNAPLLTFSFNHTSAGAPSLGTASGHGILANGLNTLGLMLGVASSGSAWLQVQRIDGTATAFDLWLQPSGGNVGIGTVSPTQSLDVNGNIHVSAGSTIFSDTGALFIRAGTGNNLNLGANNTNSLVVINTSGLFSTYGGIATVKNGVPSILASGRVVGQTSTVATVTSYAVPAVDSSFYVSGCITQNSGSGSITMPCTYTDEGGASISLNLAQITGIVAENNGTVFHLRVKASTTITIGTNVAGTVNYNAEAYISQIGV